MESEWVFVVSFNGFWMSEASLPLLKLEMMKGLFDLLIAHSQLSAAEHKAMPLNHGGLTDKTRRDETRRNATTRSERVSVSV